MDPFETLLVNSDGDEASTRTALEAAGTAFTERPAGFPWKPQARFAAWKSALRASQSPGRASKSPARMIPADPRSGRVWCCESEEAELSVRRSSIVLAVTGVVLIVLAVLVRFVVVPVATKLPGSTSLGVTYSGTATLLNSSALQSGDTKNVIAANVPTTVDRRLKVTSVHGDTAIVSDDLTIHAGSQTLPSDHTYALDRTTLEGVTPPPGIAVEPSVGALSSMFPIGPQANDSYRYYDSTTRGIVPISYTGHATRDGRSVNVYTIASAGAVKDPGLLKLLPPSLPKKLIVSLAPLLPAAVQAKITPAILAALPNPIPLSYTGTTHIVAYVDIADRRPDRPRRSPSKSSSTWPPEHRH